MLIQFTIENHREFLFHWPQGRKALIFSRENVIAWRNPAPASSETAARIAQSETQRALVQEELRLADPGITHVTARPVPGKEGEYAITTTHQALETGSLLLVDEGESSMHPLLTRHLVEKMQDPAINIHGAQLLFTSHDALLPEPCFLRRDQIRLVEKDQKSGATSVHPLSS